MTMLIERPRIRHARNLVIVRAGDNSLHHEWIASSNRDFDLCISYYGKQQDLYRNDAEFYEHRSGPKWPCIYDLLQENPYLLEQYDTFWFPDDDLSADTEVINKMFSFFHGFDLTLAQPALTKDSYYTWKRLLQQTNCYLRLCGFVEVMAPIFSREALLQCRATFSESKSGWGLDWIWPKICRNIGSGNIAVIDATPVRHTRPLGGELYKNNPELHPVNDEKFVLNKYNAQSERATAKYILLGRVKKATPSIIEKIALALFRWNRHRRIMTER